MGSNGNGVAEIDQSLDHARHLDKQDPLTRMREQFIIPSRQDLKRGTTEETSSG